MDIDSLLHEMLAAEASDLHLKVGRPPIFRVYGQLLPQNKRPPLKADDLEAAIRHLADEAQLAAFAQSLELDFAYTLGTDGRFRVNIGRQQGSLYFTMRAIRSQAPTLRELGLPQVCADLAMKPQGLVLVTGPTGSGKSTSLAAMVEHINQMAARRIITVEDPVEYLFTDQRSVITQREVGGDTHSFAAAIKYALRQDPDVIMVGEMRDLETISAALTAAETGHLVLATLHTPSAPEAIDRVVDVFPAHQQAQIRTQLAMTLAGVLAQRLVLRADGDGRVAACEVMVGSTAVRNLIREGKTAHMVSAIQTGRDMGMQTLNQGLFDLYRRQFITWDEALLQSVDVDGLKQLGGSR